MEKNASGRESVRFGEWLMHQIRDRGMNQSEFAKRVGVGTSTVSRWVNGRKPEADLIDAIADVLVLDYDLVATKAGYRPRELLELDPDSATARLMPLIEQIDWDSRPGRLEEVEAEFRFMIEVDRRQAPKKK